MSVGNRMSMLVAAGVIFAVFSLTACVTPSLPSSAEAKVSFATKSEPLPADLEWGRRSVAHELINIKDLVVVVSGGPNPIPDAEWESYRPPMPWMKNIERNLLFSATYFMRSPRADADAAGDARYTIREVSSHTWVELAQTVSVDFVPADKKTNIVKPASGRLAIKTIKKPQVMRWDETIYRLSDGQGNFYVMHATETGTPDLTVALPAGWSLEKIELSEPLVISPSQGGYFNIAGDCLGQGYHQYVFSDPLWPAK